MVVIVAITITVTITIAIITITGTSASLSAPNLSMSSLLWNRFSVIYHHIKIYNVFGPQNFYSALTCICLLAHPLTEKSRNFQLIDVQFAH
jgi:hypothetical protein